MPGGTDTHFVNKRLQSLIGYQAAKKRGKKQSAHARSDKKEWDEMAAGDADGPKTGSKTPRTKFPSRDVQCPTALGSMLGKM